MRVRVLRGAEARAAHDAAVLNELRGLHADFIQTAWAVCARQDAATQILEEIRGLLSEEEDEPDTPGEILAAAGARLDRSMPKLRKKGTPGKEEGLDVV